MWVMQADAGAGQRCSAAGRLGPGCSTSRTARALAVQAQGQSASCRGGGWAHLLAKVAGLGHARRVILGGGSGAGEQVARDCRQCRRGKMAAVVSGRWARGVLRAAEGTAELPRTQLLSTRGHKAPLAAPLVAPHATRQSSSWHSLVQRESRASHRGSVVETIVASRPQVIERTTQKLQGGGGGSEVSRHAGEVVHHRSRPTGCMAHASVSAAAANFPFCLLT